MQTPALVPFRVLPLGVLLATMLVACDSSDSGSTDATKEESAAPTSKDEPPPKSEEELRAEIKAELDAEAKALADAQAEAEAEAAAARGHCAEGLLAQGKAPPDGHERWCEKPDANGKPSGLRSGLYESWHLNGKVHQEVFYKDGLEDGAFIVHSAKGTKTTQGQYSKGTPTGTWQIWDEEGKPHQTSTYDLNGKLHGASTTYFPNGTVHIKANYASGLLDGEYVEYHESTGQVARRGTYEKGLAQGAFEDFDVDGNPAGTETYAGGVETGHTCGEGATDVESVDEETGNKIVVCEKDGKRHGPGAEYYASGNLSRAGQWVDGKKEGLWVAYRDEAPVKVKAQVTYDKGKRDGMFTSLHDDGLTLREQGEYINGKKEGPWAEWHSNGNVDNAGEYLADKRSGLWYWFHENGKLKSEVHFTDGDRTGFGKRFHDNGVIKEQGYWADDKRVGTWNVYDRKGNWKEAENCDLKKCR